MFAVKINHAGKYSPSQTETVYETDDFRLARNFAKGLLAKSPPYTAVGVFDYDTNAFIRRWDTKTGAWE